MGRSHQTTRWLTDPFLMAELGLNTQAACIVSGDSGRNANHIP